MKKLIIIASFSLVASFTVAQSKIDTIGCPAYYLVYKPVTVSGNGFSKTLTRKDFAILARFGDAGIKKALATMRIIKYNDTADIIIAILRQYN